MAIGENVRYYREKRGFTPTELARKCKRRPGVAHLGQIERGLRYPRLKTQERLASALGISVAELNVGPQYPFRESPILRIPIASGFPTVKPVPSSPPEGNLTLPADRLPGVKEEALFALRVDTDILNHENIHRGDYLIVDQATIVADGKLFLICEGEVVSIQRVFRSGPKLTLISGGAMRQVRPKDIEIVGRVVWVERGWAP